MQKWLSYGLVPLCCCVSLCISPYPSYLSNGEQAPLSWDIVHKMIMDCDGAHTIVVRCALKLPIVLLNFLEIIFIFFFCFSFQKIVFVCVCEKAQRRIECNRIL